MHEKTENAIGIRRERAHPRLATDGHPHPQQAQRGQRAQRQREGAAEHARQRRAAQVLVHVHGDGGAGPAGLRGAQGRDATQHGPGARERQVQRRAAQPALEGPSIAGRSAAQQPGPARQRGHHRRDVGVVAAAQHG